MAGPVFITTPRALGALIRTVRRQRGLDQSELAERAGVSRQWISEIENGKASAELGLVLRALAALDVHLSYTPETEGEGNESS